MDRRWIVKQAAAANGLLFTSPQRSAGNRAIHETQLLNVLANNERPRAFRAAKTRWTMLLKPPLPPMEARSVEKIPADHGWQYEPKWDGFRCIAFRDRDKIYLQSKAGQPLAGYFPDVVDGLAKLPQQQFVLDGELVIPVGGALSFNEF